MTQRACIRKTQYATQELADQIGTQLRESSGIHVRSYPCNICQQYHLTGEDVGELRPGYRPRRKSARDVAFERKRATDRMHHGHRRRGPRR